MAENKTKATNASVFQFIKSVDNDQRRKDAEVVNKLMKEITGLKPKMWGPSLIGFGKYKYKYDSGHGGEFFLSGFSPRKQNLVIYIMSGFDKYADLMDKLGKYKTGKSCLYINKLEDINITVLKKLIKKSHDQMVKTQTN